LKDLNGKELKEVSTLLEILQADRIYIYSSDGVEYVVTFQPFLRFYKPSLEDYIPQTQEVPVSTLLEILQCYSLIKNGVDLETALFQPFLRFYMETEQTQKLE